MRFFFLVINCGFFMLLMAPSSCERMPTSADNPVEQANTKALEEVPLACAVDADCAAVKADCCGCRQGGKQRAIKKQAVQDWEAKLLVTCADIMCPQVISNDISCQQKPHCEDGHCQLK